MRYPIVAIAGEAGAGKDTLAQYIAEKYGYSQFGFAWPLKRALDSMLYPDLVPGGPFGERAPLPHWDNREWKESPLPDLFAARPVFTGGEWQTQSGPVTPRFLAQTLGTEWGRSQVSADWWTQLAEREIAREKARLLSLFRGAVFTDTRFPNEVAWVKKQGGLVVMIERPDNPHRIGGGHESESLVRTLDWDIRLSNTGKVEDLYDKFEEGVTLLATGSLYQKASL